MVISDIAGGPLQAQIADAIDRHGAGDLATVLASGNTWRIG